MEKEVHLLPVTFITPFRNHPFRLYEGERLKNMADSIQKYGMRTPAIVWKHDGIYEMLAGHNRLNAAKTVGLIEIPVIIKTSLTEAEAYVYVIESNIMQRSFAELLPSEKAAVISLRLEKIVSIGRRNEILQEIAKMEGKSFKTNHEKSVNQPWSRELICEEYGLAERSLARYIRINKLEQSCKDLLDFGMLHFVSALEISYLSQIEQNLIATEINRTGCKVSKRIAQELRRNAGTLTKEKVAAVMGTVVQDKANEGFLGKIRSQ